MGGHARQPSTDEQIRHLQELVRRLGTRIPPGDAVGPLVDMEPYLGVGWFVYDPSIAPVMYIDRQRVYFQGVIVFIASTPGAAHRHPIASLPAEFLPPSTYDPKGVLFTEFQSTATATRNAFWQVGVDFSGQFYLEQNLNFPASPDLGYAPDGTAFMLDTLSYRLA